MTPDTFPPFSWGDPVDHSNRDERPDPVINPFTVVVDTREQAGWSFLSLDECSGDSTRSIEVVVYGNNEEPIWSEWFSFDENPGPWTFEDFSADSDKKFRPLIVYTETKGLKTGDYSIKGFESDICVERKSPGDAFSTFTADRDRFERELERMAVMKFAAVIIECGWEQIIAGPENKRHSDTHSQVIGKTVYRSILAWQQRFPNVHWLPMPGRAAAERCCLDVLTRFWKEREWERKEAAKARQMTLI